MTSGGSPAGWLMAFHSSVAPCFIPPREHLVFSKGIIQWIFPHGAGRSGLVAQLRAKANHPKPT